MVGIFGLAHKNPSSPSRDPHSKRPPPPYSEDAHPTEHTSPLLLATTTTQVTTTTTETTTHFFSLPHWRKRASPDRPYTHHTPETNQVNAPSASPSPALLCDKDLPPTPPRSIEEDPFLVQNRASTSTMRASSSSLASIPDTHSVVFPAHNAGSSAGGPSASPQPTHLLARAALGLGLMPRHATASTASLDVHNPALATPDLRGSPAAVSREIRRAKSFGKIAKASSDSPDPDRKAHRRTRGLSLGPLQFGVASDKGKGKEKEKDVVVTPPAEHGTDPVHPHPPKPVSRKSSFFSRIRRDSTKATPPLPPAAPIPRTPTLPELHPASPFNVDAAAAQQQQANSSSLLRRHSDRSPTPPQSSHASSSPPAKPPARRARTRRPSTAEGPRPQSAYLQGTFSPSLHPPRPTSPPPPLLKPSAPAPAQVTPTSPRAVRSATQGALRSISASTPVLPRLSLNLPANHPGASPGSTSILSSSISASPAPSVTASPRQSFTRNSADLKPRMDEESPEVYVERLLEAVNRAELAAILAGSADDFHARALRAYIGRFNFTNDPLDIALRKLLVDVGLPKETQQIDRVIETFAHQYLQCNPGLFTSDDQPYILAFSIIMLHTDAFNKSNKRKMTKADYVKNTRLPGVSSEVLDYIYDNIVFAPFIFIEDPLDVNGQHGLPERTPVRGISIFGQSTSALSTGAAASAPNALIRNNRIDPYYLITRDLLGPLRVDVESYAPLRNPYTYQGTGGGWDYDELQRAFAKAGVIEVDTGNERRMSTAFFGLAVGGASSPMLSPGSLASAAGALNDLAPPSRDVWTLKVTKFGLLQRKDDTLEGGKKAGNRKWRDWTVVLTGSQLLFFRDTNWASELAVRLSSSAEHTVPHSSLLRPDEIVSVKDAIAVFDRSYVKYPNVLRFVMPDGRHILLQTEDKQELNEWISRINYASAFKTAGVRMRALGMSMPEIELTGMAAAASHIKDMQGPHTLSSPGVRRWGHDSRTPGSHSDSSLAPSKTSLASNPDRVDLEVPVSAAIESSTQFKATFDQVKADLAAGRLAKLDDMPSILEGRARSYSLESAAPSPVSAVARHRSGTTSSAGIPSRSQVIQSKIRELNTKITAVQTQLESDLRFVRNIAVLTPFQQATRERLRAAVQNIAKKVMQVRLELEKLVCHREVLANDLAAEGRDWRRTKKLALVVATETLHRDRLERTVDVPQISEPETEGRATTSFAARRSTDAVVHRQRESSFTESFYSAVDFKELDWPMSSSNDVGSSHASFFLEASRTSESPAATPSTIDSPMEFPPPGDVSRRSTFDLPSVEEGTPVRETKSSMDAGSSTLHEKFYTAVETPEQAEEWNKTRAGKRVSLVRLPTDLRISTLFGHRTSHTNHSEGALRREPSISPSTSSSRRMSGGLPATPIRDRSGSAYVMMDI